MRNPISCLRKAHKITEGTREENAVKSDRDTKQDNAR